jgi:hypothetical protein
VVDGHENRFEQRRFSLLNCQMCHRPRQGCAPRPARNGEVFT